MQTNNLVELNFSNRLEVIINNKKPIILTDLTMAFLGVGQQFERFIENETTEQYRVGGELFIKNVRSGSIIVSTRVIKARVVCTLI
jgi:hypothetical protein